MPGVHVSWVGSRLDEGEALLDHVAGRITRVLGEPISFCRLAGPPAEAFDPERGQLSSTRVLRWLLDVRPAAAERILAVTDRDLYIPVLTFVFGEAVLGGAAAVVSVARFLHEVDGRPASTRRVRARLTKECVHELGHTFGLTHCYEPRCAMARSTNVMDVDAKRELLCDNCRELLEDLRRRDGDE